MNRAVEVAVCAMAVLLISSAAHGQDKDRKQSSNTDVRSVVCRNDLKWADINGHHRWEYNMEKHYQKDKAADAQGHPHPVLCITTGDEVRWTSNKKNFTFTITPATGCQPLFPNSPSTVPQSSHDLGPTAVTQKDCQYEVHINGIDPHIIVNPTTDDRHDHDRDKKKRTKSPTPKP